jgi:carboxyl-terminal processing protease
MPRWNLAWLVGVIGVAALGLAISRSAPLRDKDKDYELVHLIVDVLDEVDHDYVRQLDDTAKRKLVEDMINGGLMRLDEHSAFINARHYRQFNRENKGKFTGIGIQLNTDPNGLLIVHTPLVGTPAYQAGILAGDIIMKIDGRSTENMTQDDAVDLIQGEIGKTVTLTVLHEGSKEPVDIPITRAEIRVQYVLGDKRTPDNEWDFMFDKENKIAYVRMAQFSETAPEELRQALVELKKEGMRGLVLDLRTNPGGLLRSAVEVSRMFLTDGRIVSTRGREKEEEVYDADGRGAILVPAKEYPMAVLINKYSASASEIVAAALQDHNRAVIVGERSYGKGSVQNVIKMEGGKSALKLTTASYWRPNGKNIHRFFDSKETDDWGVKPNDSGYKLTKDSVNALRKASVPEAVLTKLQPLMEKRYGTENEYLDEMRKVLSSEEIGQYRGKLLEHADHGFEVPMKADERFAYLQYRRNRDIVHGKDGGQAVPPSPAKSDTDNLERRSINRSGKVTTPVPAKNGEEKEKKPFEDRVLNKALEYLRGEIKKAEAGG